jgi:hypothetical protein
MAFPAIPPPPRRTDDAEQDMAAFAQWFYHFYTAAVVQGGLLSAETQAETQDIDPNSPPSPTGTTLATAQATANMALASSAGTAALFPSLTGQAGKLPRINTGGTAFEYIAASDVVSAGGGVPQTRTITAGTGLTGGGDLSGNRALALITDWGSI